MAIEGPDGAGKSTQASLLAARLANEGWSVTPVREPGGTAIGEKIRAVLLDPSLDGMTPWTELFLFMASRKQLVDEIIRPSLAKGKAVISDRFLLSSIVYQGVVGKTGPRRVKRMAREAFGDCLPDLTVIVDLPAGKGLERARRRSRRADRVEAKGVRFARMVRRGFLWARKARLAGRSIVVDGSLAEEAVSEAIWREVRRVL